MKVRYHLSILASLSILVATVHAQAEKKGNPAIDPQPRNDWMQRHNSFVELTKKGNIGVVFLGDSITQGWEGRGKEIWKLKYAPLKAVNFGIGGDRTENVLWRLQNSEVEGIQPKAFVLMIGTNNTGRDTAPQIAEGITAIVKNIQERCPSSKVLLLGIFPRDAQAGTPARAKISEVNQIISKLGNGKNVFYLDIGERFLEQDGSISAEIMPDFLHLSAKGYEIWADSIAERLNALL